MKLVSTDEHAVCITFKDLHSNMAMTHTTYQQKTCSVRALRTLISLKRPDQPHLRPLPHSMGSGALFKLSPGPLLLVWAVLEECWSSAQLQLCLAIKLLDLTFNLWTGLTLNLYHCHEVSCSGLLVGLGCHLQVWPASLAQVLWAWALAGEGYELLAVGSPVAPGCLSPREQPCSCCFLICNLAAGG